MKTENYDDNEDEIIRYLLEGHPELDEEIWDNVAGELNRDKQSVKNRWKKIQRLEKNKIEKKEGRFNDKEDRIIRDNVEGLIVYEEIWVDLAKLLNRDKQSIKRRWILLRRGEEKIEKKKTEKKGGRFNDDEDALICIRIGGYSGVVTEAI